MLTIEALLALLKAGAILASQESVKLATKQAFEALRGKLTQILGAPTVKAAEAGNVASLSASGVREKLLAASDDTRDHLDSALKAVMGDPAMQAAMPGRLYASLRNASFKGDITLILEDHITNVVIDAQGVDADNFSLTAKKNN